MPSGFHGGFQISPGFNDCLNETYSQTVEGRFAVGGDLDNPGLFQVSSEVFGCRFFLWHVQQWRFNRLTGDGGLQFFE
jgi:hypothetical protein